MIRDFFKNPERPGAACPAAPNTIFSLVGLAKVGDGNVDIGSVHFGRTV